MIVGDIYLDAENILRGKGNALDAPTIQALMAGFEDILSQESATVRQVRAYGKYRFIETAADGTTTKREGDPAVRRFVKFVRSATRFDVHIFDIDKFSPGPAARGEKVWVGVFRVPTGPNKAELRLVADFLHPKARVREPVLVLFGGGDQKHMLDRLAVEVDPVRSFFVIPNSAP